MKTAATLLVLLVSSAVQAQPYVALGFFDGTAKVQFGPGVEGAVSGFPVPAAGYRFNKLLAVEVSYQDFDTITTERRSASGLVVTAHSWEATSFALHAVVSLPLSASVALVGKAGAHHFWTETSSVTTTFSLLPPFPTTVQPGPIDSRSYWAPALGAGVQFTPSAGRISYRLTYETTEAKELDRLRMFSGHVAMAF